MPPVFQNDTLATCWEELTHWKRPWCWERLKVGGERVNRGWGGWMASLTRWKWVWSSFRNWDGQGSLVCCSPRGLKESDATEWRNWTDAFCLKELLVWKLQNDDFSNSIISSIFNTRYSTTRRNFIFFPIYLFIISLDSWIPKVIIHCYHDLF